MDATTSRQPSTTGHAQVVAAAIELVAGGRYPRVALTGIPDITSIADALRPEAARRGVDLVLVERTGGLPTGLVAQRR